mgnify:CR=1 FL=1
MTDASATTDATKIKIPPAVKENFPDLIPQILASPSMDDEERNYWFSVLPIMSPEQVAELRDILASEQKNRNKGKDDDPEVDVEAVEAKRDARWEEMRSKEQQAKSQDHDKAEELLEGLEEL